MESSSATCSTGNLALRSDSFPAGLRVLVVDDDPACLKILHKMLIKCKYEVSLCNSAQEALDFLEKRKDGIDIVMSDVNVADMDGFKFLEQVGLKMDLPVIMMSVDGETSRVMKGVQHGACDYLLKPIRMKELRNIWQHVFRKRIHEVKVDPKQDDQTPPLNNSSAIGNKRKDDDCKAAVDPTSLKKPRVVWTIDLHHKFVKAVNRIGLDKVGPKKILDLMGVPWLTRENVASHLQKYRLYLSRMHKENDLKASCSGMKLSEYSSERQNLVTLQQNIVINESYGAHIHNHNTGSICEANILALPMQAEAEVADDPHPSRIDYNPLMKSESKIHAHYTWSGGPPTSHPHPQHFASRREVDQSIEANINHYYSKNRSYAIGTDHAMLSITQQTHLTHSHAPEDHNLHNNLESTFKNMIVGTAPAATALRVRNDVELNSYSSATASDHIYHLQNPHQVVSLESFGGTNLVVADHARPELYEMHNFEDEYGPNAVGYYDTNHQGLYYE